MFEIHHFSKRFPRLMSFGSILKLQLFRSSEYNSLITRNFFLFSPDYVLPINRIQPPFILFLFLAKTFFLTFRIGLTSHPSKGGVLQPALHGFYCPFSTPPPPELFLIFQRRNSDDQFPPPHNSKSGLLLFFSDSTKHFVVEYISLMVPLSPWSPHPADFSEGYWEAVGYCTVVSVPVDVYTTWLIPEGWVALPRAGC